MTEEEEFEFRARAEAETPKEDVPAEGGFWSGVGETAKKVGVGALNVLDKISHFGQPQAAKDLVQKVATDPKGAPTNPQMASQLPSPWMAMGMASPMGSVPVPPPGMDMRPSQAAAVDAATSPLTYLSGGLSALQKIPAVAAAMQSAGRVPQAVNKFAGRMAEEASGVPEEALRAYGTPAGRAAIVQNAGKEFEIGQDIVNRIENFEDYLPEKEAVNKILELMPDISPEKALEALRKSKVKTTRAPGIAPRVEVTQTPEGPTLTNLTNYEGPARNRTFDNLMGDPEIKVVGGEAGKDLTVMPIGDAANRKIDDLITRLRLVAGEDVHTGQMGKIPAKEYRNIRANYDTEAKAAFKKDERELIEKALINTRSQMAEDLRLAANTMGDKEYAGLMSRYSDKLDKLDRVKKYLGSNAETREARAEGFVSNLLNANKTSQQNLMRDLEDIFDADFMDRIQGAKWAKQIGKDGSPAILPTQFTGRANLAQTLMGVVGLPFSSPWIASRATLPIFQAAATARPNVSPMIQGASRLPAIMALRAQMEGQ